MLTCPLDLTSLKIGTSFTSSNFSHLVVDGIPPFRFFNLSSLPIGILLNSSGFMYGVPLVTGSWNVTLEVQDAGGASYINVCSMQVSETVTLFGRNLILNGGGEESEGGNLFGLIYPPTFWLHFFSGLKVTRYSIPNGWPAGYSNNITLGNNYFDGGFSSSPSAFQSVGIWDIASRVDHGCVNFTFRGLLGGYQNLEDYMNVSLSFMSAEDVLLDNVPLGILTAALRGGTSKMVAFSRSGRIPRQAKFFKVSLACVRFGTPKSYCDGYADNLSVELVDLQCPGVTTVPVLSTSSVSSTSRTVSRTVSTSTPNTFGSTTAPTFSRAVSTSVPNTFGSTTAPTAPTSTSGGSTTNSLTRTTTILSTSETSSPAPPLTSTCFSAVASEKSMLVSAGVRADCNISGVVCRLFDAQCRVVATPSLVFGNAASGNVSLPFLVAISGNLQCVGNMVLSLDFPALNSVSGSLLITTCTSLVSANFKNLFLVKNDVTIQVSLFVLFIFFC